ncbi:MAG: hypothetical protein JWM11_3154 [Planctomycetaceae bacterium]|nr:hypothetical protein [Planctomycetaceae bacterium]
MGPFEKPQNGFNMQLIPRFLFLLFLESTFTFASATHAFGIPQLPTPDSELASADLVVLAKWDPKNSALTNAQTISEVKETELIVTKVIFGQAKPGRLQIKLTRRIWFRMNPTKSDVWNCWDLEYENPIDITKEQIWFLFRAPSITTESNALVCLDGIQSASLETYFKTLRCEPGRLPDLLRSANPDVRSRTLTNLVEQRVELTHTEISDCAFDSDPRVRLTLARYFETHDSATVRNTLYRYLEDTELSVRAAAICILLRKRDEIDCAKLAKACSTITEPWKAIDVINVLDTWKKPELNCCYLAFLENDQIGEYSPGSLIPTTPAVASRARLASRTGLWLPLNRNMAARIFDQHRNGLLPSSSDKNGKFNPERMLLGNATITQTGILTVRVRNCTDNDLTIPRLPSTIILSDQEDSFIANEHVLTRNELKASDFQTIKAGNTLEFNFVFEQYNGNPKQVDLVYLWKGADFGFSAWQGTVRLPLKQDN